MKSKFWLPLVVFIITSCSSYQDVEFKGTENLKFGKLDGKKISLTFDARLENQNGYTIKIKPSDLDVFIDNVQLGTIHLDEKIKIKRKSESLVEVPLTVELGPNALLNIAKIMVKKNVSLRLAGDVKGGVWFLSKKQHIDETREISTDQLKFQF